MHTRLSVNINKVALIRNSRGSDMPNLAKVAKDCEGYGAEGITVHPRPDERHVKYADIPVLKKVCQTEFNIEGNPTAKFLEVVLANPPAQCTLVPDDPDQLTSDHGWDTIKHETFLTEVIQELQRAGIRVSIFMDPDPKLIEGAAKVGADRIEFYTGPYAKHYKKDREAAVKPYKEMAAFAHQLGLGINAGHDLNLDNLAFFKHSVPHLAEVSIGHALICDALYFGFSNVIQLYLLRLNEK